MFDDEEFEESNLLICDQCPPLENSMIWRRRLHLLMYHPESSIWASMMQSMIVFLVLITSIEVVLESINSLDYLEVLWITVERLATAVFTLEFILRMIASYDLRKFVKNLGNWIDFIAILPLYISIILNFQAAGQGHLIILRAFRIFRVIRLFKMVRYIAVMKVFQKTMYDSKEALILLVLFVLFVSIILGSLITMIEGGEWDDVAQDYLRSDGKPSPYKSIPVGIYWAITTLSSVGFGDVYPVEDWGRFVACIAMVSGIFVFSLPLAVIGSSFQTAFKEYKTMNIKKRRRKKNKTIRNQKLKSEFRHVIKKYDKMAEDINNMISILHFQCNQSLKSEENNMTLAYIKKKQIIVDNAFKSVSAHTDSNIQTMKASVWGILDNVDKFAELIHICKQDWEEDNPGMVSKIISSAKIARKSSKEPTQIEMNQNVGGAQML